MVLTTTDPQALRDAFDQSTHETMRLATAVLAGLLLVFSAIDLLVTIPPQHATQIALFDLACAAALFATHVAYRRGKVHARHAHAVGAGIAFLVAADILHDIALLRDGEQTTYLMLVVVAAGSLLLNGRWLGAVVGGSFGGWLLVATLVPHSNWTTFGFALLAACVLSVLIHTVRYRTLERMDALRSAESGRKQQLEIRETALRSAVEALQESEERYRRLVEDAPDAFVVHREGKIVYANTAAVKLFGATDPKTLLGKNAYSFFHQDDRETMRRRAVVVQLEGRATEPMEMRCVRLDGTQIAVETLGLPITYLGEPADQTIIRDITDRKRAESARQVASQRLAEISRLKEMDRVKTQFVNTISHELRTPLTPIKVQLHILRGAKDAAVAKKATEVLDRNVSRLASLVDELLEVARIQAGTLTLAKTYVDVSTIVGHALGSFFDVARQNGIELASKLEPGVMILGDDKRIQQIIYNLLGNAFKFTDKGGSIVVEVRREGANALVSVQDSGVGIEPTEIARLFEPFSQLHDTMEKTNAGTGLGLYICRGIVEGHGGRIYTESPGRGRGARFAFTIPLAKG